MALVGVLSGIASFIYFTPNQSIDQSFSLMFSLSLALTLSNTPVSTVLDATKDIVEVKDTICKM